jgi:hypothetical protein
MRDGRYDRLDDSSMDCQTWTLEELLPRYDRRECHARTIAATVPVVWAALNDLTMTEVPLTRWLMALRSAGRARLSGRVIDALPPRLINSVPGRELVLGSIGQYARLRPRQGSGPATPTAFAGFSQAGWSKVAMNFRLTPDGTGTVLSTETRVVSGDAATRRRFAGYWLIIRVGSGLIRREMLRSVARRAEAAASTD